MATGRKQGFYLDSSILNRLLLCLRQRFRSFVENLASRWRAIFRGKGEGAEVGVTLGFFCGGISPVLSWTRCNKCERTRTTRRAGVLCAHLCSCSRRRRCYCGIQRILLLRGAHPKQFSVLISSKHLLSAGKLSAPMPSCCLSLFVCLLYSS